MGYMHIDNLYKAPEFLQCYALEKIHGTSAHVALGVEDDGTVGVRFFAGGCSHDSFTRLFDADNLVAVMARKFTSLGGPLGTALEAKVCLTIYGEAFGGKMQAMSSTYGKDLRFLAFDVKLDTGSGPIWLDVPAADKIVQEFGLGFVPYERGPLNLAFLDQERDRDCLVAVEPGKMREGIVIRPIREQTYKTGERVIYKHKRPEFMETKTHREVDADKAVVLAKASAIAEEYVTPMRLKHVVDKTPFRTDKDTRLVIAAMIEDIKREAGTEVVWSREAEKAIGHATAKLLHGPLHNEFVTTE